MTIYIAGPMSNLPDLNYPEFDRVAAILRGSGHEVLNPAENPKCDNWAGYMRISIPQVCRADAVALLPGYEESLGATLEAHVAMEIGMRCLPWDEYI